MPASPNLLFVFADQLGARMLPLSGHPVVQAPTLLRLANEGMLFQQAYTTSPLCTPYRGCLLTGRYPTQTGIRENGDALPVGETTLAHRLNEAGYQTSYVGKWHLSGEPHALRWVPPEKRGGFQDFLGWESHHVDHWQGVIFENDPDGPIKMSGHETGALTDMACDRLDRLAGDEPFCLFVSYQAPHPPCTPPEAYMALYEEGDLFPEPNADREVGYHKPGWNAAYDAREFRQRYFGEISHLDAAFGRLLDHLDATGLADNTIVVFTSDHGEMAACHGRYSKMVMLEESVRVPLLIRLPGGPAGIRSDRPVSTVDLHATLGTLCGLPVDPRGEGTCFATTVRTGQAGDPAPPLFLEYKELAVVEAGWKLIASRSCVPYALYCIDDDPYEMHNRVDDAGCVDRVAFLLKTLRAWVAHVGLEKA